MTDDELNKEELAESEEKEDEDEEEEPEFWELDEEEQQAIFRELIKNAMRSDDSSELEEFVEEHEDDDVAEPVFRMAVQMGFADYVDAHADDDDIEINDIDGCTSSYLSETTDEDTLQVLRDHGACRDWDEFTEAGFNFACDTNNGYILALDPKFQQEVFQKYLEEHDLTEEQVVSMLDENDDTEAGCDLLNDMEKLGVISDGETLDFHTPDEMGAGTELHELLEELGYECEFEGDSWKLETLGVYYIEK